MDTQNEVKQTQTESLQIQKKLEDQISQLNRELEDGAVREFQYINRLSGLSLSHSKILQVPFESTIYFSDELDFCALTS